MWRSMVQKIIPTMCLLGSMLGHASAQLPNNGDITLVVGYPPGSFSDTSSHLFAKYLGDALGRNVLVEAKPGAAGMIGLSSVQRSRPDGHTLYFALSPAITLSPIIQRKNDFSTLKDLTYIAPTAQYGYVLITSPNSKIKTIQDLFAEAKARPNQITFGSGGYGTSTHIGVELLSQLAGVKMKHIPYKGNAASLRDVMAGRVDFMLDFVGTVKPHMDEGKVRPIAMVTLKRHPFLPDTPTVSELGGVFANFEVAGMMGILTAPDTPEPIKKALEDAVKKVNAHPEYQEKMRNLGFTLTPPAWGAKEFLQSMTNEYKMWQAATKDLPPL